MSSDNAVAVLGGYSTALGTAESVMADRYKTPWITTGAGATAIFGKGYQYAFGTLAQLQPLAQPPPNFLALSLTRASSKRD